MKITTTKKLKSTVIIALIAVLSIISANNVSAKVMNIKGHRPSKHANHKPNQSIREIHFK
jgi:hypothetical protein